MVMTNKNFAGGRGKMQPPKRISKAEMDTIRHYGPGEVRIVEVRLNRAFDRYPIGAVLRMYTVDYGLFQKHGVPHTARVMGANEAERVNCLIYIDGNCGKHLIADPEDALPRALDFKPPAQPQAIAQPQAEPEPKAERTAEPKPKRKYKRRKKGNH